MEQQDDARVSTALGEDITETLEVVPRQWKVIQTVREKILWATG